MKKIKFLLTGIIVLLLSGSAVAEIFDRQFVGTWILESAELREAPLNKSKKETKIAYTLENIDEILFFDAIIEMKFAQTIEEGSDSTDEIDEQQLDSIEETTEDYDYITTITQQYKNPLVQISTIHFEFPDSEQEEQAEEVRINQYEYIFTEPEKLLLISSEVFYTKDEKEPVSARLYITLSRTSN